MKINKLYDDLYEIENFLSDEEFEEVCKIIKNTSEQDWYSEESRIKHQTPDFWFGKSLHFEEDNIFNIVNDKMRNLLESYSMYPKNMHLQRYKKGDFIKYHADQWKPDLGYYIGYGFCLYFNDEYSGGELKYPDLNIKVKPKANSLYIHGGHIVHGSLPVLDDKIRYFSTVFVYGTKDRPTVLRGDLFK